MTTKSRGHAGTAWTWDGASVGVSHPLAMRRPAEERSSKVCRLSSTMHIIVCQPTLESCLHLTSLSAAGRGCCAFSCLLANSHGLLRLRSPLVLPRCIGEPSQDATLKGRPAPPSCAYAAQHRHRRAGALPAQLPVQKGEQDSWAVAQHAHSTEHVTCVSCQFWLRPVYPGPPTL